MKPIIPKFAVGDLTCMTPANLAALKTYNRNRCTGIRWSSDEFYKAAMEVSKLAGTVTHIFPPGHEATVRYLPAEGKAQNLHMRANFASRASDVLGGGVFIAYPDYINRAEVEKDGSLYGLFRVVDINCVEETSLLSASACMLIAYAVLDGKLQERFGAEHLKEIGTYHFDMVPRVEKRAVTVVAGNCEFARQKALDVNIGFKHVGEG